MKMPNQSQLLPHVRSAARAVVLAAALTGLAACSGGSGGADHRQDSSADQLAADPLTAVRGAADITGRTGSAHAVTELVTESAEKKAVFTGVGGYDYVRRIGRLEVAVPPGAATTGKIVEVVLPGIVYLQNSGAKVPAGKWVKLDVRQLPDGNLVSSGATDPAGAAGALRGAQKAELVGAETVGGVALKHYRGTLDLAKAAEATGGRGADGLRMAAQTFTVKEVPYEVWLDGQGRLHKVVEVFSFAGVAGSKEAKDQVKVTSTTSLSDFGKAVDAAEPAAGDIWSMNATEPPK
ncbi:lipoprotein [Kitasatospora indigofera]|uniref:Lipoprotein n=2 Tax=Kitasatospora indigofera TaxID=67307 RepID=A0A919G879_9ACTN|nr:lipoprotein [Kitasatospora indigofera]